VTPGRWSDGTRVLAALVLALALGAAIAASGSATALRIADALRPVGTLWVNAIRMTLVPLVVSLLITGVASVADLASVGKLGVRTLIVFAALLTGSAAVSIVVGPLLFSLYPWESTRFPLPPGAIEAAQEVAASAGTGVSGGLVDWFTQLVPTNPVAAAASGNMVSLILFTFLLALAVAKSPPDTRNTLVGFFRAMAEVMLLLVRWVIALAPLAVFALVLPLAAHGAGSFAGAIGFYIVAFAITCAVVVALFYPVVAIVGNIPMARFASEVLQPQLIGVSCSSSIATLPAMVDAARRLGLPERVNGFVLPLAVSLFKSAAPVAWVIGVLFIGRFYGIELGARELGIVVVASIVLSFAAPGVPRGAFILLTPLFEAIGLPPEGIGVLIAVDAIPDMCATVVNVTGDLAATAVVDGTERVESRK
jgi:Na+/H+-dicarboxylate symporter